MFDFKIAGVVHNTTVDGEGLRTSIYFQGCPIKCPGCHNEEYQDISKGVSVSVSSVIEEISQDKFIDGITILGGEPFYQIQALHFLVKRYRKAFPQKSIWVYTGYTLNQVLKGPKVVHEILNNIDYLVVGPYIKTKPTDKPFIGSSNQEILCIKDLLQQGLLRSC